MAKEKKVKATKVAKAAKTAKGEQKFQPLKKAVMTKIVAVVAIGLAMILFFAVAGGYQYVEGSLQDTMAPMAESIAYTVDREMEVTRATVTELTQQPAFDRIDNITSIYGAVSAFSKNHPEYSSVVPVMADGSVVGFPGTSLAGYTFFQEAKASKQPYVSRPEMGENGSVNINIVVPILRNGEFTGAVLATRTADFLSDMLSYIFVGKTGHVYIITDDGTVFASKDSSEVTNKVNHLTQGGKLAEMEQQAINGTTVFGSATVNGVKKTVAAANIRNTFGWAVVLTVDDSEFYAQCNQGALMLIGISVLILVVALLILNNVMEKIVRPLELCSAKLKSLASGNLRGEKLNIQDNTEIGIVAEATELIQTQLQGIISDIQRVLGAIAENDLTAEPQVAYNGDFLPIKDAMESITVSLNQILQDLNTTSSEVLAGSQQVAEAAQSLAEGATMQASAVEELDANIQGVSDQIENNASSAVEATENSHKAADLVSQGNEQMAQMVSAMKNINETSGKIANIIKTIEDIAFQTNILALNASVEAARAGQAGKGFSVVAEEVRNLANRSSLAAHDTTELIDQAIRAVAEGTKIVSATEETLRQIVSSTQATQGMVGQIAEASDAQATSIHEVTIGVEQISTVTQTNSATAQQSAAAAEELSAQAQTLQDIVERFRLKN